jgi:hypothetical protein
MINPWFALGLQTAWLAWEAPTVVALRMVRLAAGGVPSVSKARLLVSEKMDVLAEAGAAAASIAVSGGSGHKVAKGVPNVYKKRVGQNRRRQSTTPSSDTISHAVVRDAMSNRSLNAD